MGPFKQLVIKVIKVITYIIVILVDQVIIARDLKHNDSMNLYLRLFNDQIVTLNQIITELNHMIPRLNIFIQWVDHTTNNYDKH